MWFQCCIEIILVAFSLRELHRARYWLTRWSWGEFRWRGQAMPPVLKCKTLMRFSVFLLIIMGAIWFRGFVSVTNPFCGDIRCAGPSYVTTFKHDACAASLHALQATHWRLLRSTLVGAGLSAICWVLFPHWHDQLDDMGGLLLAATPAGQRMITIRSYIIGFLFMLARNLVQPVFPWLLLSDALFGYRCVHTYAGLFSIIVYSMMSYIYVRALVFFDSMDDIIHAGVFHIDITP